jgi:RNA polymerase sigma factor (sigma-70 family)
MNSMTGSKHRGPGHTPPAPHDMPKRRGLSRDEESELAGLIANGDRDARDRLVLANLGLVVVIARNFWGQGLDSDDLIGEGNLGLIRAAEKFDPSFGITFCKYAAYWIQANIRTALINTARTIRIPIHTFQLLLKWRRVKSMLCRQSGRVPKCEDVTSVLDLSPDQKSMVAHAHAAYQLKPSGPQRIDELPDREPPCEDIVDSGDEREVALVRMERLEHRERKVVTSRYGMEGERMTLAQVDRFFGLTRERVRQIENCAIRKLRDDHRPRTVESNAASRWPVRRHGELQCR